MRLGKGNELRDVIEEIKARSKESLVSNLRHEEYPIEFVYEDLEYFIGKRAKATLKGAIRGLTLFRLYARIGTRYKDIRGKSLKKTEKKYSKREYVYTIEYMDRLLKEKGYLPDDRKRAIFFFFNFILPEVISNAGIYLVYKKRRTNTYLKKMKMERIREFIPSRWLKYIDAYLLLIPKVKRKR